MRHGRIIAFAAMSAAMISAAHAQYNGNKATPGNCYAAIEKAQENNNEWDAPFDKDDCRAVFGKMIDDGYEMIERANRDDN